MKIELVKWAPEFAEELARLANNQNIAKNLRNAFPYPYAVADAREYIALSRGENPERAMTFAVVADGRVAGSVGVFRQTDIYSHCAELGYWLGEEYWNKGIMTQAIRAICIRAYAVWDISRIYAEPFAFNVGSRRALEKNGFSLEGIMRNGACKDSKTFDWCMYALLREDFRFA